MLQVFHTGLGYDKWICMKQIFWFVTFKRCLSSGNLEVFTKEHKEQVGKIQMLVLKSHCETATELKTLLR